MTIKATYEALRTVAATVLPTFEFYGMYKSRYNSVKQIADNTIIIEPPRQWPANYRNTCQARFTTKVWLLIRQSIKPATGGVEQYPPFSEIDIRDTLVTAALTLINGINSHSNLAIIGDFNGLSDLITLTDAVEGTTTNIEAGAYFTIVIDSYGTTGSYTPQTYAPGPTWETRMTISNGDTLPTGVYPDTLFITTGAITADIETLPFTLIVPDGYYFDSAVVDNAGDEVYNFRFANDNDDLTTAFDLIGKKVIWRTFDRYPVTGNAMIYCSGNAAPGFQVVAKFNRSLL